MRVFIAVLVLILNLQLQSKADDISEFEIEGMSLGDSALDFFTVKELNKRKKFYSNTNSKKFFRTTVTSSKFKNFDNIMFHFKENDSNYIIESISGAVFFSKSSINTTQKCIKKRNIIDQEVSKLFKDTKREVQEDKIYAWDKSKKSKTHNITYWFKEGGYAGLSCYVFSKEFDGTSHLKVLVNSAELTNWINNL